MYYVLDADGEPRRVDDVMEWARWFDANRDALWVAVTDIGDARISTVFLGVDSQPGDGPPILYETMIFGGEHDEQQWRWPTRAAAVAGHGQIVAAIQAGRDPAGEE